MSMRTKEEIMEINDVSPNELDGRMLQSFSMAIFYLEDVRDIWLCKRGEHKWDVWSCQMAGNVSELDLLDKDRFCYRACMNCGQEMLESRIYFQKDIREKNSITFEEYKKKNY